MAEAAENHAARAAERRPPSVNLAFERGGSHGAFTWACLDRLLDEPWIEVEAISGTPAEAVNAALFVRGMA